MKKYGVIKQCKHCGNEFETRPRYVDFCSTACKNPINRPGNIAWNKGLKMTEEQKSKMNLDGLEKGRGWNKGLKNPEQSEKWSGEGNPNYNGKVNNSRPSKPKDSEFEIYKAECKKATYRSVKILKEQGKVPSNTGKRKYDMQLDHIIPFKQGYELGLDPSIIGGISNLQYITGEENRKKWDSFQPINIVNEVLQNGL
jgi:hypothetical protein